MDPFDFFRDETSQCLIAIRRIEPTVERGITVAGHLPSLTLSPGEAQNLASILVHKPGYGGGLYAVQHQRQKPTGGYEFASSFRLRVAGPSRALELHEQATAAQQALPPAAQPSQQAMPPQQPAMAGMHGYPPPWYYAQPQPAQVAPVPAPTGASMADLPRLLESLAGIVRAQPMSPIMGQMDVVQLIQSLQSTVKPEDEFSKFAKFLGLMDRVRGKAKSDESEASSSAPGMDWTAVIGALRDVLRPAAPAPTMAARPMVQRQPSMPMQVPAPPGWAWNGSEWVEIARPKAPEPEPDPGVEDEEADPGIEDEEEEEDDEPMTADEVAASVIEEMQKMTPEEQAKLKQMASAILGM